MAELEDHASPTTSVETDTTCLSCGYNLRGLAVDGNCPECGDEIERSLRGNLLRFADTAWVQSLYRGVRTLHLSVLVAIIALIGMFALSIGLGIFYFSAAPAGGNAPPNAIAIGIGGTLTLISGVASLALIIAYPIGWWLATRPDPAESEDRARDRTILRATASLAVPVFVWWSSSRSSGVFPPSVFRAAIEVSSHVCFAIIWAHLFYGVRHYTYVATRCAPMSAKDDRKLTKRLKTARRYAVSVPVILLVCHWIAAAISLVMNASGGAAGGGAAAFAGGAFGWGRGVGPILMTLLTLDIVLLCGGVVKAVAHEREVAKAIPLERV